jgi:protein phosphatase
MVLHAAGFSDVGCKRLQNQDRIWWDTERGVFVVADGMGGERCGDVAAEVSVRAIADFLLQAERSEAYAWPFGYDNSLTTTQNHVVNAIRFANKRVWDELQTRPECEGMGSTISALFVHDDTATVGNIGDSRVYLGREGQLRQLTRDDAVVFNLLEAGIITPEESKHHPMRNVLTLALGLAEDVTVQLVEFILKPGDWLLLSSDGLHGVVDASDLKHAFDRRDEVEVASRNLIQAALDLGGPDNVSCIVVSCG